MDKSSNDFIIQKAIESGIESVTHNDKLYKITKASSSKYKVHIYMNNKLKISQQLTVIMHNKLQFEVNSETYYHSDETIKTHYQQLWSNIFLDHDRQKAYLRVENSYYQITTASN
jgi:hypothetical protein